MRPTITLSSKDLRRLTTLRDRVVAFVDELETHVNGGAPNRRRRRKAAAEAPPLAPTRPKTPRRRETSEAGGHSAP